MALNPIVFTEKVVRSFLRYQLTSYPFADEGLHGQMGRVGQGLRRLCQCTGVYPFRGGKTGQAILDFNVSYRPVILGGNWQHDNVQRYYPQNRCRSLAEGHYSEDTLL